MDINVTPRFRKNYQRLPMEIQRKAKVKETVFRKNPFDKRLRTHKLSGKEKEAWFLGRLFIPNKIHIPQKRSGFISGRREA